MGSTGLPRDPRIRKRTSVQRMSRRNSCSDPTRPFYARGNIFGFPHSPRGVTEDMFETQEMVVKDVSSTLEIYYSIVTKYLMRHRECMTAPSRIRSTILFKERGDVPDFGSFPVAPCRLCTMEQVSRSSPSRVDMCGFTTM